MTMFSILTSLAVPLATLTLYGSLSLAAMAQPQPTVSITESTHLNALRRTHRSPKPGVPTNTGNGSSRDGLRCPGDTATMYPLLPEEPYGWTLNERPEIFVEGLETSAQQALLVFRHSESAAYQHVIIPIHSAVTNSVATNSIDNVVGFRLPDHVPGLAVGETYRWSLTFICGDHYRLTDPSVTGWVTRQAISPVIEQSLRNLSSEETIQWLGNNSYWYDMVEQWLHG